MTNGLRDIDKFNGLKEESQPELKPVVHCSFIATPNDRENPTYTKVEVRITSMFVVTPNNEIFPIEQMPDPGIMFIKGDLNPWLDPEAFPMQAVVTDAYWDKDNFELRINGHVFECDRNIGWLELYCIPRNINPRWVFDAIMLNFIDALKEGSVSFSLTN